MFAVPQMVRWLLSLELNILWMDTDVVALSDPFPVSRDGCAAWSHGGSAGTRHR